jgi:hypothetical protein
MNVYRFKEFRHYFNARFASTYGARCNVFFFLLFTAHYTENLHILAYNLLRAGSLPE